MMVHDQVGIYDQYGFYGSYAYRINFGKNRLSIGLSAGFSEYKADWNKIKTSNPNDAAFIFNSPNILVPNFGTGLFLYQPNKYYVGVSSPRLLRNKLDFSEGKVNTTKIQGQYRYYFATAGYVFDVSKSVKIEPPMLLKFASELPGQLDVNIQFIFYDFLKVGTSYRTGNAFIFMLEYQLSNKFSLGYSYDLINSEIGVYTNGSHEVMIRYEFAFDRGKIMNPRYF